MISTTGHLLLFCSIIASTITIISALFTQARAVQYALNIQALSALSAFCMLIVGFCLSDFSLQNVFMHSSSITPLLFKISAAWASHEGSILLWFALLSIVSALCINGGLIQGDLALLKASGIILGSLLFAFGAFIYYACDPFLAISIKAHQGMGMSPILQDVALAIHPPILYMGYVSSLAPFLFCNLALIYPSKALDIIRACGVWSKFSWLMLLAGVSLGSWWAYRELGWGGFWFFDPVENISLMPLIAATAFHHSLIFTVHNGKMIRWTVFLGLSVFLLTLLGTFLVRSGLLTSVHAFADNSGRTAWLLGIFGGVASASYLLYIVRLRQLASPKLFPGSKEQGVYFGNIIWIGAIITILFAVVYPVVLMKFGYNITVSTDYFVTTFIPIVIPTILLAGTFAYFKAQGTKMRDYYISSGLAVLVTYIFYSHFGIIITIACFSGAFLIISTIFKFLEKTRFFRDSLSPKMAAMLLSHAGYGLMVLSIAINSAMQSEADFIGKRGDSINSKEYRITLRNISYSQGENYYRQITEFWLEDKSGQTLILRPENRLYHVEKAMTAESDIYSSLWADTYAVLSKIDGDVVHAKIYWRPGIGLLWIAMTMMGGGIVISLLGKKRQ